jgi:hypothetical protein
MLRIWSIPVFLVAVIVLARTSDGATATLPDTEEEEIFE